MSSTTKCFVAVIGVGLVGSEFIDQLLAQFPPSLFQLVSISSSKKTVSVSLAPKAFTRSSWRGTLAESTSPADLPTLLSEFENLTKSGHKVVVVDNTASDSVAGFYPMFLKAGLNLITPNKKVFSSDLTLYNEIKTSSENSGARFFHESTVGAALPVISTLKDLITTGDTVTKIEGVFSGTMSYIFNNFSTTQTGGPSFSSVVVTARTKGYTEPHPADDLNGADVARKVTILSRYISSLASALPAGYKDVATTSLVPHELDGVATGDEFVRLLPQFDAHFEKMRQDAQAEKKVMRFVGLIDVERRVIQAGLENYPYDHPFATSLGGSDNIFMFHTKRYGERPLIVQGAGAGAAVTAMGVLSDLLKLV